MSIVIICIHPLSFRKVNKHVASSYWILMIRCIMSYLLNSGEGSQGESQLWTGTLRKLVG